MSKDKEQRLIKYYEKHLSHLDCLEFMRKIENDEQLNSILDELDEELGDIIYRWIEEGNSFDNPVSQTKAKLIENYMIGQAIQSVGGYPLTTSESFIVNGQNYGINAFVVPDSGGDAKHDALYVLFIKEESDN